MIRLTIKISGDTNDDCADGVTVRLPEPQGNRVLVDGSRGETLIVSAPTLPITDGEHVRDVQLVDD